MMMYYFLFLRRKPKINCTKKTLEQMTQIPKHFWWDHVPGRTCLLYCIGKDIFWSLRLTILFLLERWFSGFLLNVFVCHVESYCITSCCFFFIFFFLFFFKYAQKNSPVHETSLMVVLIVVLKWKIFDFKITITTTIKQWY